MAHVAAYWTLTRRSERDAPEASVAAGPGVSGPVGAVASEALSEFPYSGDDVCKLCGNTLSRYNANVVCFSCIDRAYADGSINRDKRLRGLFRKRRPLNPKYTSVDRSEIDTRMMRRSRSGIVRRGTSRP